ncbi:MAG: 3-hydroxyacyl-CoA dehydrogenase family protein [Bacillota bacterium]
MYIFKAAVIGAGTMGAEIAQVISWSGLPVVLKDVDQKFVDRGMEKIKAIYGRRVKSGKMSQGEADSKLALVIPAVDYKEFKDVDIVIEAVPEKMELKKKIFAELDQVCPSTTILASNTSALSISEMAAATRRAPRVVGLHFFFPASVMKLVEVIAGRETSDETMDTAVEFTESLRKLPVRVRECAGFLVNRVLMASMTEVLKFQEETNTPYSEVDELMKAKGGVPIGPFSLSDTLGLDIALDVAYTLEKAYGERFTPTRSLVDLVKAGNLGTKTGKGFYNYTG